MKYLSLFVATFLLSGSAVAQTAEDVGLYDTGTVLSDGSNPYTLISWPASGTAGGPGQHQQSTTYSLRTLSSDDWPVDDGTWYTSSDYSAQWLAVYAVSSSSGGFFPGGSSSNDSSSGDAATVPAGTYTIELTFDLSSLYAEYTSFSFSFVAAADNTLTVALNGTTLTNGSTVDSDGDAYGSLSYYSYTIDSSQLEDGENTLTFYVTNASSSGNNPAGLYVHFTDLTVAVPEPATYAALFGLGTLAFTVYRRRKRR